MTAPRLDALPDIPRLRYWGDRKPPKNRAEMFASRVTAAAGGGGSKAGGGSTATLRMYGPIDSWGGFWGISAKDVSEALDSLGDDVTTVQVRINSPGGECWEAIAILNMLRAHKARIVAVVDGIAASAASVIATGCDETVMSPGTQMMIHDASGFAFGNEKTMLKAAEMLSSISNAIASIYAESAGGGTAKWRKAMQDETWYTADEAVEAKLADRVAVVPDAGKTSTAGEGGDGPDLPDPGAVEDRFDLSMFNYAGRSHAPAPIALACRCGPDGADVPVDGKWQHKNECPKTPVAPASGDHNPGEEEAVVAFSDEAIQTLRQKLGVTAEDADESTILAALDEVLEEHDDGTDPDPAPDPEPQPNPTPTPTPQAEDTITVPKVAWEETQLAARQGAAAAKKIHEQEREEFLDSVRTKFLPSNRDTWRKEYDKDPDATRAHFADAAEIIPTSFTGQDVNPEATVDDATYRALFGDEQKEKVS